MLQRVHDARPTYNNNTSITSSTTLTSVKLQYYRAFAWLYSLVGTCADVVMVNSNWTKGHIDQLWSSPHSLGQPASAPSGALVVFPPCNTTQLQQAPLDTRRRMSGRRLVSVGQFRPEKDHCLQLSALAALRSKGSQYNDVTLHLIGGCRHHEDQELVASLRSAAVQLGIQDAVHFRLNEPFPVLMQALRSCAVGLHTMWNEHFGIGVVEMMVSLASCMSPLCHVCSLHS
jgi:alpha-1,2-mannosyltransferase